MPKKFLPAKPELFIHQPVQLVKVNRLERLEKLVGGMKKTGLILWRERLEVLQTRSQMRDISAFSMNVFVTCRTAAAAASWAATLATRVLRCTSLAR
jgi:hypothetical protein